MYAAHVLLIHHGREICHAQNPNTTCARCATAAAPWPKAP